MEPVTTIAGVWSIAKAAGEVSKKLYELGKSLKDRETKQQLDQILDSVRELKQAASKLEDENRELREKLRFKSDEYQFRSPFHYHKARPEVAPCPKCFSKNISGPMGRQAPGDDYRLCLVCNQTVDVGSSSGFYPGNGDAF